MAHIGDIVDEEEDNVFMELSACMDPPPVLKTIRAPQKNILLILDLNKVLVFRKSKKKSFIKRPFVDSFLHTISTQFVLAIWTSVKKSKAVNILRDLFRNSGHQKSSRYQLLFEWYHEMCDEESASHCKEEMSKSLAPSTPIESMDEDPSEKRKFVIPIMTKNLAKVWESFPSFGSSNTLLLDDSVEKCYRNPRANCINPTPFTLENAHCDEELKPGGPLLNYLRALKASSLTVEEFVDLHGPYVTGETKYASLFDSNQEDCGDVGDEMIGKDDIEMSMSTEIGDDSTTKSCGNAANIKRNLQSVGR